MVDFWQLNTTVTAPGAALPQYTDALVLTQEINLGHQTVSPHERMGLGMRLVPSRLNTQVP